MKEGIITVSGIRLYAYHGCLQEENKIGGNYIVDVTIFTDYKQAAITDDLSLTVDYCRVFEIVKMEMMIPSKLIENVAHRIATSIKTQLQRIEKVEIRLTKIAPPVNGDVQSVSVTSTF
jgi:7,8-dihydroneopterin aldolase/epimerase/oxygenase